MAAATGQGDLVHVLFDAGADWRAKNNEGQCIIFLLKNASQNNAVKRILQKLRTKAGNIFMMTTVRNAPKNFCKEKRSNFANVYRQMGIYNVTYVPKRFSLPATPTSWLPANTLVIMAIPFA